MKPTAKEEGTHAYVARVVLVTICMVLFTAVMHGQQLPNAPQPQAAVRHQTPPLHYRGPQLARPGNPGLGSADWFRERGYFKLSRFMPVLRHIGWHSSCDKPKETGRGSRKSR